MDSGALALKNREWLTTVTRLVFEAERRRVRADYDTGSISEEEAYLLLALAERIRARIVIEVGTFIGTSTTALAAGSTVDTVYTCDASNDCLPSDYKIHVYPKQSSTDMLRDLVKRKVQADLCFFDGTLTDRDVLLLQLVTLQSTVFAFHDYNYGPKVREKGRMEIMPRKGIGNVRLLQPKLPRHVLVTPPDGTTLALLVPESRL